MSPGPIHPIRMRKAVGVSPCDYTSPPVYTALLISGVLRVFSATLLSPCYHVPPLYISILCAHPANNFLPPNLLPPPIQRSVSLFLFYPTFKQPPRCLIASLRAKHGGEHITTTLRITVTSFVFRIMVWGPCRAGLIEESFPRKMNGPAS